MQKKQVEQKMIPDRLKKIITIHFQINNMFKFLPLQMMPNEIRNVCETMNHTIKNTQHLTPHIIFIVKYTPKFDVHAFYFKYQMKQTTIEV